MKQFIYVLLLFSMVQASDRPLASKRALFSDVTQNGASSSSDNLNSASIPEEERQLNDVLAKLRVLVRLNKANKEAIENCSSAIELASKKLEHDTPQKRVPEIYEKVYQILTGKSAEQRSPFKPSPNKARRTKKHHEQIFKYIKSDPQIKEVFLSLLNDFKFRNFLSERGLETVLVNLDHIFVGRGSVPKRSGGHVFDTTREEEFNRTIVRPARRLGKSIHTNKKTGVVICDNKSIFPRDLMEEEIFILIRDPKPFLARNDFRGLIDSGRGFYMEMFLQDENENMIGTTFPIFSCIDVDFSDESGLVEIFSSDIQTLNVSRKSLKACIENLIRKSPDRIKYRLQNGNIVVDVASCYSNVTGINCGIYIMFDHKFLDARLHSIIEIQCSKPELLRRLSSPFSTESVNYLTASSSSSSSHT